MKRLMVFMRGLLVSWFVLASLVVPIGGELFSAQASECMASEAARMEEYSASDEILARVGRIATGEKARTVPLVVSSSHHVGTHVSPPAPSLERAVTASLRSHARPVYQHISVYRI